MKSLTLEVTLMLAAAPIHAQSSDGYIPFLKAGELYELCAKDHVQCTTYVAGVADVMSFLGSSTNACPPRDMTIQQAILAFQRYAMKDPASLSSGAADMVRLGMIDAFSCRPRQFFATTPPAANR